MKEGRALEEYGRRLLLLRDQAQEHVRSNIAARTAQTRAVLSRQLVSAVLRWNYEGDDYADVDDLTAREALQTYTAWRGRMYADEPQYEQWVGWLRMQFGLSEERDNASLLREALKKAGALREGENYEHLLRTRSERVIVPAIYRGMVRLMEGEEGEREREEERARTGVQSEGNDQYPAVAKTYGKKYNIIIRMASESANNTPSTIPLPQFQRSKEYVRWLGKGLRAQTLKAVYGISSEEKPVVAPQPEKPADTKPEEAPATDKQAEKKKGEKTPAEKK